MGPKIMYEFEDEIRAYCKLNNIDADYLLRLPKFGNQNSMGFQVVRRSKLGLLDETPAPVVLWVFREGDGVRFEQTEDTEKYLKS